MSDEKTTALAQAPAAPLATAGEQAKSLIADLARNAGVEPQKFYAAVKVAAGCRGAEDSHFLVLLMQAQRYGLDPLSSPPQLQLLDVGQGPQVYARLDAYKAFLHRAEAAGKIEWRKYEECWLPDPAFSPTAKDRPLKRAGKVTMKLRGHPDPVEKIVWFGEWAGKGQWQNRGSHMLEARAWKEACRDWLGFFVYDMDDAEKIKGDEPRRVDAEVSDTPGRPAVPIPTLRRAPPAPLDLDEEPQRQSSSFPNPHAADGHPAGAVPLRDPQGKPEVSSAGSPVSAEGVVPQSQGIGSEMPVSRPAELDDLPDPNSEEGKRLARELDEEAARASGSLFEET